MGDTRDMELTANSTRHRAREAAIDLLGEKRVRALARRYSDVRAYSRARFTPAGRQTKLALKPYRNRHLGETCVIIGNGPSLNQTPMHLLRDVPTFGLNRLYLMYERLGFSTTYHVVVNKYVVEQCTQDLLTLGAPVFSTVANRRHLPDSDHRILLEKLTGPYFSRDVTRGVWEGATVTFVAMQLAYFMGFTRVILVGVDHNFTSKGPAHKLVESTGGDANHFDPSYFGKGFKWQLPDLETSEMAYSLADRVFTESGRTIVDATVGGKLEVFPKTDLAEALRRRQ